MISSRPTKRDFLRLLGRVGCGVAPRESDSIRLTNRPVVRLVVD
jgi:hypothetical protein